MDDSPASQPLNDVAALRRDAEHLAEQLPRAASRDEALDVAIRAVEASLKALRLLTEPAEKARYSRRVQQLMSDAEAVKSKADWRQPTRTLLQEPANSRELTTAEQITLLQNGFLNRVKFPPWTGPPRPAEFERHDGEDLFLDEFSELPLSDFQLEVLDDWKRPAEALPPPSWFAAGDARPGPVMRVDDGAIDLVQDAATDCSVVASLCAVIARARRGHPRLLSTFMFPYDETRNCPLLSPNGKYIMRLNFNGCYRRVLIDDRLPTSSAKRVVHVVDRNHPALLWPALLEKAYLKVRGGYDFPGSNSSTDLWILFGWIPEQVFLQADELEPDRFWKRIATGLTHGDVLITMGTGKISSETESVLGLAGEHDYAVLDLREIQGQRLLLIKNPWVKGTSWRSPSHVATHAPQHPDPGPVYNSTHSTKDCETVRLPRDLLNDGEQLSSGTFWMDLDNVLCHFESIYLNWNPGLFRHRKDIHFHWDLSAVTDDITSKSCRGTHASLRKNPQFTIVADTDGLVWVLLSRHFQNSVPEDATAEDIEDGRPFIDLNGHIAVAVFSSRGRRVLLPERHLQKGWFVDSPQTLLKLDECEAGMSYTIVPLEQDLPSTNHTFTLSTFSNSPMRLTLALPRFSHTTETYGAWTKDTAGGNAQQPTYCDNPQYTLTVTNRSSVSLLLEACSPRLNVHVKLLHGAGQRVFRVRSKEIVVDSKDYRPTCCLAEVDDLAAGRYTVICSTFEACQFSEFTLRIESSQPVHAAQLPRDGAGRIRTELPAVTLHDSENVMAVPLLPNRLINFYAIARHRSPLDAAGRRSQSHLRLAIESGQVHQQNTLVASNPAGEYPDMAGRVRTEAVDLGPEWKRNQQQQAWIVLERTYFSPGRQVEEFVVELFVDQPDAINVGEWRPWQG